MELETSNALLIVMIIVILLFYVYQPNAECFTQGPGDGQIITSPDDNKFYLRPGYALNWIKTDPSLFDPLQPGTDGTLYMFNRPNYLQPFNTMNVYENNLNMGNITGGSLFGNNIRSPISLKFEIGGNPIGKYSLPSTFAIANVSTFSAKVIPYYAALVRKFGGPPPLWTTVEIGGRAIGDPFTPIENIH